jgi:beta-mannosidase
MASRQISLNGVWTYEPEAWVTITSLDTTDERETDLPAAGEMAIPGHWQGTALQSFDGRVRFSRAFDFDGLDDGEASVWLVFRGVDYVADVAVNGQEIGSHAGYFQPFEFDVTDVVRTGENRIDVAVTCPLEAPGTVWPDEKVVIKGILNHWDCRPGSWDPATGQDQHSGGIWNDVYLETRPVAWVGHTRVTTRLVPREAPEGFSHNRVIPDNVPRQAIVLVDAELHGESGAYTLHVTIADEAPVTLPVHVDAESRRHTVAVQIPEPKLWWTWDLGEPHLESCTVEILRDGSPVDRKRFDIGIREVRLDPERGEWWLNGTRVFIRGTNVIPSLWLGQYDRIAIERDIELLRGAHINGVRVCVHINREEFYDACDRAGILIWQDFALQWGYSQEPGFMQEAVRQIRDMVRLLVNHPSIAVWCCQNESTFHNKQILDPVLAEAVRLEDGSRFVRPTSEFSEHTYVGWYRGHYRDYSALPATPILTEFGAQALPNVESLQQFAGDQWPPDWTRLAYHDFQYDQTFNVAGVDPGESWEAFVRNSQAYQARLLKFAIEGYRTAKYRELGGMFQFMFMDCWPSITWSVVDAERCPKEGYRTLQQAYQPVLIGCELDRDAFITGVDLGSKLRPLVVNPWVVNDLHRSLTGCAYDVEVVGPGGTFAWQADRRVNIGADAEVERLPAVVCELPRDLADGDYRLTLTLREGDNVLSRNAYPLTVTRTPTQV